MYNPKTMNAFLDGFFNNNLKQHPLEVSPRVNVSENEEGYLLEMLIPGIDKNAMKISIENGILTISHDSDFNKKEDERKMLRHEFNIASFKRSYHLDEKINAEAIEATYKNGILQLTLPKKEEVKAAAKEIAIN